MSTSVISTAMPTTTETKKETIADLLSEVTKRVSQNLPQLAEQIMTSENVSKANEAFSMFSSECDAIDKLLWKTCTNASEAHLNKISDLLL